jgi:hypothetical protein
MEQLLLTAISSDSQVKVCQMPRSWRDLDLRHGHHGCVSDVL